MTRKALALFMLVILGSSFSPGKFPQMTSAQNSPDVSFDALTEGMDLAGFRTQAVYLNDSDKPFGARFRHSRTGFTLDFLEIQSVPQAFAWVNSFPTSERGEPHTQEHLLLGKGNVGRARSGLESMSLAVSSAFTEQLRTCYHFHTGGGPEVFYQLFESQMQALLYPDYTDEEIRREVSHWGVNEDANKRLHLEEKGTVYQEMVTTYERPDSLIDRVQRRLIYGAEHPLARSAGGWPDAIRQMKPEDIRKFHSDNYHLGNMGMVASFPKEMPLAQTLGRLDGILNQLEPKQESRRYQSEADLPAPKPAPAGKIELVEYPDKNENQPVGLLFAWPAQLKLATSEKTLLDLFLQSIAGDATTNFYKMFVDSKTRVMDTGAQGVYGYLDGQAADGNPIYIGLTDVAPGKMTEPNITLIRRKIMDEIKRIAMLPDGSAELKEFNERVRSRVIQSRRAGSKFVNSPPGFGFRNATSGWMLHLFELNRTPEFRKSVTLKPQLAAAEQMLSGRENQWRKLIATWRLAGTVPFAVAARPVPKLIARIEQERVARERAQALLIKKKYRLNLEQQALRRFQAEYDATTANLDRLAQQTQSLRFLEHPPLTLDDQLDYKVTTLGGGLTFVASNFENMTSASTGLGLRLDGVPEDRLFYLSALPSLLTETGVIKDGRAISYEEMSEMLRKEILGLGCDSSVNLKTGQAELMLRGAGNDAAESQRALEWMKLVVTNPDWRVENLPRIRDVVDQLLSGLRSRMQDAEENWVNDPAAAYRRQDSPLILTTASFLTQAHNVHRLRWLLKDAGAGESRNAISSFLSNLAGAAAKGNRRELRSLLAALQNKKDTPVPPGLRTLNAEFGRLSEGAKVLAGEAAKDLDQLLPDIPDASLAKDWDYLCRQMRRDLLIPPAQALAELNAVRQGLLRTGGARVFMTGSSATMQKLETSVRDLLSGLETAGFTPAKYSSSRLIEGRVRNRTGGNETPTFVGLVNPNTQGGVFLNSASLAGYDDSDNRELLLDYLSSLLYSGAGAHSVFIKTWGAGLAYSNGFASDPEMGRIDYYAERTPELPQTLRFVIGEIKNAKADPGLVEYAIAMAFSQFNSASQYEERGEAIANDIADGMPPEKVRKFRQALLELRRMPNLSDELFKRMGGVYARVLPGFGPKARNIQGGVFYVIGPEKQLAAYEQYLKSVEGTNARLYRIYPRDYWMTLKELDK